MDLNGDFEDTPDDGSGFYDDDGTKVNPELIRKPSLCLTCKRDDDPRERMLCTLNRFGQQDEDDFRCGAYERRTDC